jgi:D-serine deaminase-like pyridoxal phosphate-dependent protein
LEEAGKFYAGEVACVNDAAARARELGLKGDWVLSVGATPTAHAAILGAATPSGLHGTLELHAGCYCLNDLQQAATGLVRDGGLALSVLATVVSKYPERGEAMSDCGALAVSKDTGPAPGYGRVVSAGHEGWTLGRVSQEHGVLVKGEGRDLAVGERVRIVPQHACLACACFPWFYVVEGGDTVVDVWVPWKGWSYASCGRLCAQLTLTSS